MRASGKNKLEIIKALESQGATEKEARLFKGKAILLFGPRQTGKSTLIHAILSAQEKSFLYLNVVLA